jgi:uroporphyrin-III C-methyltransferase
MIGMQSDTHLPPRQAPARMAALATLPIFLGLQGRKAVVAGGSDAAAWKAELLAACGAEVHVFAPDAGLSETFRSLIHSSPSDPDTGRYIHHARNWNPACLSNAAVAIADCETDEEAEAFSIAARTASVPVNVIDKPPFCQFQFGSIVNRSPVVVAISTDGAAPILAQAIRRRIETLLPPAVKQWAALAQALRERVNERLTPGPNRRLFWERFADRALGGRDTPDAAATRDLLRDTAIIAAKPPVGRVTLVGAGPGDAEYLTLKAMRALQSADIILFDDLVSDEVLELARREAKRMLVGKRGGRESCRQEDINQMMVSLAKAGKHVVRLKSGDPMVFGRAGEEIAVLKENGIPVEVVPGITAASAMAARYGISLTHRDHAQAVRFVTGHARNGHLPENLDWRGLADPRTTTVFYMGGRTAPDIRSRLLANGMASGTPVVIVSAVTRANERHWSGTLDRLHHGMAEIGYDEPVLIGIGTAFTAARLAEQGPQLDAAV